MAPCSRSNHGEGKLEQTSRKIAKSAALIYKIRLLRCFHKDEKIWGSANITRSIGLPEGYQKLQIGGGAAVAGSEEKIPTPPAQSFRMKEIGERTATAEVASIAAARAAAVLIPMAASSASVKGVTRSDEKGPTSPAGVGSLRAIVLVLTAVVAVAVPTLLLSRFNGHPMSQVWVLSVSICVYVFLLLRICQSRWFYIDILRLSYGPLLAFFIASQIGSATAILVLLFSTVWAAGNLGYSLAVYRLRKGAELAIHVLPSPSSCPTKDAKELNLTLYTGAPFVVLLWTLGIAVFLNVAAFTDELDILMLLAYFGWIHVAAWLIIVGMLPMDGFLQEVLMEWLMPALFPWVIISPAICLISQILAVLCHLLLMVALVAFLWYDLAIYMHFLATATPSTTTQGNKDTMHSKILEGKIGQVNSDPRLGETASEVAATLLNEDTPMNTDILQDKIRQVKSGPRLVTTLSDAAATLGNEIPRQIEILEDKIGQMEFFSNTWGNHRRTSSF